MIAIKLGNGGIYADTFNHHFCGWSDLIFYDGYVVYVWREKVKAQYMTLFLELAPKNHWNRALVLKRHKTLAEGQEFTQDWVERMGEVRPVDNACKVLLVKIEAEKTLRKAKPKKS